MLRALRGFRNCSSRLDRYGRNQSLGMITCRIARIKDLYLGNEVDDLLCRGKYKVMDIAFGLNKTAW